jgi:predicted unusual protein kinase regulating ubiquinone biosynthesis (AarF/ABC1/UbiB family)
MLKLGSIGLSYLYDLITSTNKNEESDNSQLNSGAIKLRSVKKNLEQQGGVFSKIAQMLTYDDDQSSVFSECKPYAREKTLKYLKKYMEETERSFTVDYEIHRSGSVGQVHIGHIKETNEKVAVKVQYKGLAKRTDDDLKSLSLLASVLYKFTDSKQAIVDVTQKIHEELDFRFELKNHKLVYDIWKDTDIIIPKIYEKDCTEKVIITEFMEGSDLSDFILTASQESKNKIAKDMMKFLLTNIYKHNFFYSDLHYGNVIIKDNRLMVIDFGCLNFFDTTTVKTFIKIHKTLKNEDKDEFINALRDLGVITDKVSQESIDYAYPYFRNIYMPWLVPTFEFSIDWWEKINYKETKLLSEWGLPPNIIYLNKLPYGFFKIMAILKATGNFAEMVDEIIKEAEELLENEDADLDLELANELEGLE